MSFGVANTGQEMASLIQLAMAQAAKMGISATQAFNDLVTGVGRLSPMILDDLGVTVSAEKAYADYAATLGKTAEQLNQTEQRQAFLNAMMAAAPNAANEAGIAADKAAGGFQRMDAAMANLTTATRGIPLRAGWRIRRLGSHRCKWCGRVPESFGHTNQRSHSQHEPVDCRSGEPDRSRQRGIREFGTGGE